MAITKKAIPKAPKPIVLRDVRQRRAETESCLQKVCFIVNSELSEMVEKTVKKEKLTGQEAGKLLKYGELMVKLSREEREHAKMNESLDNLSNEELLKKLPADLRSHAKALLDGENS